MIAKKIEAIAIATIMVVSVFAGIMPAILPAMAYQSGGTGDLDNPITNVSINSSYLVAGDAFNVTYERMLVSLNFSVHLTANVTNITLDFSDNLLATTGSLPVVVNNTAIDAGNNAINITNVSFFNVSQVFVKVYNSNKTIEFYNTTNTSVHGETAYFSISNITMPSVNPDSNLTINISATNLTGNVNWTKVYLTIRDDEVKPTLTNLVMSTLGSTDVVSEGVIEEVWNVTTNASNPPIVFNLNDTLSGVKNGTIRVYIDDASNVLLNGTINAGNVTMAGRNATVDLSTSTYFTASAAGNLSAGETHTLNVTVSDNSTNMRSNYIAKTFYIPRVVMGATRTADITADGADPVTITAHLLEPDGSIDTSAGNVQFTSDSGVSFDGGSNTAFKPNSNGVVTVLTNFSTSETHTITALFNGTTNDIKIKTVAVVANVTATAARPTLVANGTDSCNITLQAVDASENPVLKSGYNVTITAVSSVGGSSPNITTTTTQTDANGRDNRTLTASTTEGEVITITPYIELAGGGWAVGSPIQVTFVSGEPAKMKLYSSQGTVSGGVAPINLTVTGIVAGNTTTFTANITDANDHPLPGQTVTFTLLTGGLGTLLTGSDVTESNGNATVDFKTGLTKGDNVSIINVTVSLNASLFNYIDVSTTNGTADHLLLTASPTGLPADGASNSTVTARVVDINDNSVVNYAGLANVTFAMSPTNLGNLSASYNLTNASGYADVNFTAGTAEGTVTITATANVTLPGGNTTTTTITLGIPNRIELTADRTNIPTDGSVNATATAALYKDAIPIGMENVNMTFLLTNGTLYEYQNNTWNGSSIKVLTNDTGAKAVNVSGSGAVETVTLMVVSPDYPAISAVSKDFTFTGTATKFSLTNTTPTVPNATGWTNSTITVQLLDSADNEVGAVATVLFGKTDGTLSANVGDTNVTTGILNVTLSANTTTGAVTSTVTATISGMVPPSQSVTVTLPEPTAPGALTVTANVTSVVVNTETAVEFTVTSVGAAVEGALVSVSQAGVELVNGTTVSTGLVTLLVNATSTAIVNVTATKEGYTEGNTTIPVTTGVKGDFDGDEDIDFDDFVEFAGAFGALTCADANYDAIADFDDDCNVDFDDFVEFAGVFTG